MSELTVEQIRKLSKLAKITFSQEEEQLFSQQLTQILDVVEVLQSVNCDGVEPMFSVLDYVSQRLRDDVVQQDSKKGELFCNYHQTCPNKLDVPYFIVPKVIE
ncbi:Aspartyl/glutamyl-tRNA(Asn/Gln) amidotransferase subunit C [Rickettsiales endosymbiont of Paramecium tredecaurelia]|uniref:Asp-tRNA(Asn)/Glu-tRNA(Gln) amidotransferase subunit GatC n=1 Tax=Candidatus Sarmatiella mevalonica TaxID=2770581 RepID=UPI001920EA64|nr:Asp-tRNA(Asn)/Glu-tRNA(Gln) amidotransferase subunit GatC [Candidatus Sarmatiella mevalonica]MBL3284891.1 Aspartyl/glutamyl-tRNA(Asn/Gln) amidotransferase subunit C [Candidatus Sarmatiella mevalonica]